MDQSEGFLPDAYEAPKNSGNYMKFQDGANRFRIMGRTIVGWVYWTVTDGKRAPVRLREQPDVAPDDIAPDSKVKHFWAFPVWNYETESIQILEIVQSTIQDAIRTYVDDPDWGDPEGYDLKVARSGKDLETKYQVTTAPASVVAEVAVKALAATPLNLDALYDGDDPFAIPEDTGKSTAKAVPKV